MAEATHTAEAVYGLKKAVGKGHRMWAGKITLANDGDTLDTGLDTIEACVPTPIQADISSDGYLEHVSVESISGGIVTFNAYKDPLISGDDSATTTDLTASVIATGTVQGA